MSLWTTAFATAFYEVAAAMSLTVAVVLRQAAWRGLQRLPRSCTCRAAEASRGLGNERSSRSKARLNDDDDNDRPAPPRPKGRPATGSDKDMVNPPRNDESRE